MENHDDFLEFKDGDSVETKIVNISKNGTLLENKKYSFLKYNIIILFGSEIIFKGRWYYIDVCLLHSMCIT